MKHLPSWKKAIALVLCVSLTVCIGACTKKTGKTTPDPEKEMTGDSILKKRNAVSPTAFSESSTCITNNYNYLTRRYISGNDLIQANSEQNDRLQKLKITDLLSVSEVSALNASTTENGGRLYKRFGFEQSLDLSSLPIISYNIQHSGGSVKCRILTDLVLYNGDQSFQSIRTVHPYTTEDISFDVSSCSFLSSIDTIEFGYRIINEKNEYVTKNVNFTISGVTANFVLDLFFDIAGQTNAFNVTGGSIKQEDGKLVYEFNESESSLTSVNFGSASETIYNMLMPQRNTIMAVIKNDSSVSKLKVSFTSTSSKKLTEATEKTFDIKPNSDYTAYYFNLSDLKKCNGRLTSIALTPVGDNISGTMYIDRITFEEEYIITDNAGMIYSAIADKDTNLITVRGGISEEMYSTHNTGEIKIYAASMGDGDNNKTGKTLLSSVSLSGLQKDENGLYAFSINDVPLNGKKISHLSSELLALLVDGSKSIIVGERFTIDNWQDFGENPYAFELPDMSVKVTDSVYGALGDGFTDDTEAIQKAIDYISSEGGGRVVIPAYEASISDIAKTLNEYKAYESCILGRRYVVTCLVMKSNVELYIEHGAVIWQSQIDSEYAYEPRYGHDNTTDFPGINWTHNMHVSNYPMIYACECNNIKLSGGGTIRSADVGSEEGIQMPGFPDSCPDRLHVIPLGMYKVTNASVTNIDIVRTNNYHFAFYTSHNLYAGNIKMHEVKCVSGDGIGFAYGSSHAYITSCFLQSNDDGIVIEASYNDPRGMLWWKAQPGIDEGTKYITVTHSYIYSGGGKAISIIPWGTDDPNQKNQEISDITVYDCYLESVNPVGTWPDNPYFGAQPFDNTETNDFSPVKNIRIHDNVYVGNSTLSPIVLTNVITDCRIYSSSVFVNGDFSNDGYTNWTLDKNSSFESAGDIVRDNDFCGYITDFDKGEVSLYEGLFLKKGSYSISAELKTEGGATCTFFVKNAVTGQLITSKDYSGESFTNVSIDFDIADKDTYLIGITNGTYTGDGTAYIDNASITNNGG